MYELVLAANAFIWLALIGHFSTTKNASAFHPAAYYLFFHGLVFTIRPIVAWHNQYDSIYDLAEYYPSEFDKIQAIVAANIGLIFFYFSCIITGKETLNFKNDKFNRIEIKKLWPVYLIVCAIIAPLGVMSALDSWGAKAMDASTMAFDYATGVRFNTETSGYWADLQIVLGPLAAMAVWIFRFRWWSFLPLIGFVVLRAGTGSRWPFLMACGTVALLFLFEHRRRAPRIKEIIIPIIALLLFQSVGEDRGAAIRRIFTDDRSIEGNQAPIESRFLEGMDFANMEYLEFVIYAVPQRTGSYNYFLDNLQILTEPIPRVWWADKPLGAPIKMFNLWDYARPIGMTYSLPGNGWMQLGYLGVILWCSLFGWMYGRIYNWFQKSDQSALKTLSYLLILPLSVQVFRDGLLLTMIKTHIWFLLPIILIYFLARLSAIPLASDMRMLAMRRGLVRRQPDIAAKILARQRGRVPQPLRRPVGRRPRLPAE